MNNSVQFLSKYIRYILSYYNHFVYTTKYNHLVVYLKDSNEGELYILINILFEYINYFEKRIKNKKIIKIISIKYILYISYDFVDNIKIYLL